MERREVEEEQAAVIDTAPSSLPFSVRPMHEGDIPAVMDIEQRSFPSPWPESAYRYELRYRVNSRFYVLQPSEEAAAPPARHDPLRGVFREEEPPILGYVGLRLKNSEVHICTLAVHPDWRRKGLGEFLLLVALERALRHRARRVTLEVRPSNQAAQQLYAKAGFIRVRMRRAYYRDGEDAWVMVLELLDRACVTRLRDLRQAVVARLTGEPSVFTGR